MNALPFAEPSLPEEDLEEFELSDLDLKESLRQQQKFMTGPDISEEDQAGARFPKMIPCSNWELSRCRSVHPCDLAPAKELGV
eukprot:symbB.v1.2.012531.t1/scaffold819.1/size162441/2